MIYPKNNNSNNNKNGTKAKSAQQKKKNGLIVFELFTRTRRANQVKTQKIE